jgi:hypothetical protein
LSDFSTEGPLHVDPHFRRRPCPTGCGVEGAPAVPGRNPRGPGHHFAGQLDTTPRTPESDEERRIGRLLIDLGYVTEALLADAVADQLRLPTVDLASVEISPEALQRVPRDLALKHRILPWMVDGRDLYLITADPTDMATIDAIGFKTGMRIKPVVAVESELGSAIERHYAPEEVQQVGPPKPSTWPTSWPSSTRMRRRGPEDELERRRGPDRSAH